MAINFETFLCSMLIMTSVLMPVTQAADDASPLEAVVSSLSQKLDDVTARLSVLETAQSK
jgi:hypothetical protein